MNRKGDERILSLYWFVIFAIIAIAVVSGVILFYSHPIDVREAEASILIDRVVGCLVQGGKINIVILNRIEGNNNILDNECGLIFIDESKSAYKDKGNQFYIAINVSGKQINYGNMDYKVYCGTAESNKNIPICLERKLFVLNGEQLELLKVNVAIRKVEQNAI